MMNTLKIALLQIAPCGALEKNLEKGMNACRKAKEMGADIALFPEMRSNGCDIYGRPKKYRLLTDTKIDSPFIRDDYRG